jgi:hypothetical protein
MISFLVRLPSQIKNSFNVKKIFSKKPFGVAVKPNLVGGLSFCLT